MDDGDGRSHRRKRSRPLGNLNEPLEPTRKGARLSEEEDDEAASSQQSDVLNGVNHRNRGARDRHRRPQASGRGGGLPSSDDEEAFSEASEEDESDNDGRMTDSVAHQPVLQSPAQPVARDRPGMLRQLVVYNFLCHERMEINFAKNITYIVGRNGSGKSAICAALQIVLGSRAGDTDRGQSMAAVVREGATTCVIRLALSNRGTSEHEATPPWRPDVFGDDIIIERTIRVSPGGSNARQETKFYASKAQLSKGQSVPGFGAEELRDLRENLVIFPGNVLMVTKQESMKRLANAQPKKLYDYFMEATLLQDTHRRVESGKQQTSGSESRLLVARSQREEREERWRALRREVRQLEQRVHGHRNLRVRVTECEHQVQWAHVLEVERRIEAKRDEIEANKQENRALHERIVQRTERLAKLQEEEANVVTRMDEELEASRELGERVREADAAMRSHRRPVHLAERAVEAAQRELNRANADLAQEERKLTQAQQRLPEESVEAQMERARDAIASAQRERTQALEELENQQEALKELETQATKFNDAQDSARAECRKARAEVEGADETIRALQSGSAGSRTAAIASLGPDHRRLHDAIERAPRDLFSQRPIGPLAAYIRIKDDFKHWKKAVEAGVVAMRARWVVTSHRDERALRRLCASMQPSCSPRVIVLPLQPPHVVDSKLCRGIQGRPSVFDALEFDEEIVRQAIVSLLPLDETILVADRPDFERVRRSHPGVTMGMDKHGGRLEFKDGDMSLTPTHVGKFLGISAEDEIKKQQQKKQRAEATYQEAREKVDKAARDARQMEKQRATLRRTVEQIQARIKHAERKENDAKRDFRQLERQVEDHPALQDEVEMQRAEVETATDRVRLAREDLEQAERSLEEAREQLEPFAKRHRDLRAQLERFQADTNLQDEYSRWHDRIIRETSRIDTLRETLRKKEAALEEKNAALQRDIDDSRDLRPQARENTGQAEPADPSISCAEAERQLRRAREQLEECVASSHDVQLLHQKEQELAAAKQDYDSFKEKEEQVKLTVKRIREQLLKRDYRLQEIAADIRAKVAEQFSTMMSMKGHVGSIEFHPEGSGEEGLLRMAISPDAFSRGAIPSLSQLPVPTSGNGSEDDNEEAGAAGDQEDVLQDVGTLSGGEKSYTALNLLLAIARSASFPWRVMDEFDVFMDEGTRKLAMDQIHHSMDSNVIDPFGTSQLVLITPHDVSSSVNAYNRQAQERHGPSRLDIRVLQLDDPERSN